MAPLGHGGLALANSVAVTLEVLALLILLQRRLGRVLDRDFGSLLARLLVASAAMGGAILLLTDLCRPRRLGQPADPCPRWSSGGCGVSRGMSVAQGAASCRASWLR